MEERLNNLGEGIESGSVVGVLVSAGDQVQEGQTLIEVESEKAVLPIPATRAGTIAKLRVAPGDAVSVGQAILEYDASPDSEGGAPPPSAQPESAAALPAAAPQAPPSAPISASEGWVALAAPEGPMPAASPAARRIAHQLQFDLRQVPLRSRGDRVELDDIRQWLHGLIARAAAPPSAAAADRKEAPPSISFETWGPVRREKLSEIRKAISRRMVESKNAQPHVTQFETVDVTDLESARKSRAREWQRAGAPLTLTVLAVKAAVSALRKHPIFNASLDEATREIVFKDYYHVGVAADTPHGLMVPIIRNADQKTLSEIAETLPKLAERARTRSLPAEDMKGGTFTISNQGGIGGGHFTPVINRPEAAILGIGRAAWQAGVVDGAVQPRLMLPLTVSYDHRLIDGGAAVRFTLDLIEALQSFAEQDLDISISLPKTPNKHDSSR